MDQASGRIESNGPANQTKHRPELLTSSKATVVTLVEALEQGNAEKSSSSWKQPVSF